MERYIVKGKKRLRYGYTTGSCSAGAAKAAAIMLLTGEEVGTVKIPTPKGWELTLTIHDIKQMTASVSCAVQKDSGDDPDSTNGIFIYAEVSKIAAGVEITGGEGIGMVTQKGLSIPPGQHAINPTPRQMIREAVQDVAAAYSYGGGFRVVISAPQGRAIAKKTFNDKLGIIGGISILGTSGIVEPMSEDALKESLRIEINILREKHIPILIFCPGNYGWHFADETLHLPMAYAVKMSNYVGDMLDHALARGFKKLLMVSHVGKLVKVAGGIMNTHSHFADCRAEIVAAHALLHGADAELAKAILACKTTDAMIEELKSKNLDKVTMQSIVDKVEDYMSQRVGDNLEVGAVMFSKEHGLLGIGDIGHKLLGDFEELGKTGDSKIKDDEETMDE